MTENDPITNWLSKTIQEELQLIGQIQCCSESDNALEYLITAQADPVIGCPDIFFPDLNVPVINGFDLMDELMLLENQEQHCKQVVIFIGLIVFGRGPMPLLQRSAAYFFPERFGVSSWQRMIQ